jgi:hypothetical protein
MEIAKGWLGGSDSVKRLALFCRIFQGARTSEEALEVLLAKIPWFKKKPREQIKDLLIQINRPRPSNIDDSKSINRFVQWSARVVTMSATSPPFRNELPIPFSLAQAAAIQRARATTPFHRAQAEIDINTPGESEIPKVLIARHLEEMASLMLELAENGDVP